MAAQKTGPKLGKKPSIGGLLAPSLMEVMEVLHPSDLRGTSTIFNRLDKDDSGKLTQDDIEGQINEKQFSMVDSDKDGSITVLELLQFLKPSAYKTYKKISSVKNTFDELDTDKSGDLDFEEMSILNPSITNDAMAKMDINHDGTLSFVEICSLFDDELKDGLLNAEQSKLKPAASKPKPAASKPKPKAPAMLQVKKLASNKTAIPQVLNLIETQTTRILNDEAEFKKAKAKILKDKLELRNFKTVVEAKIRVEGLDLSTESE